MVARTRSQTRKLQNQTQKMAVNSSSPGRSGAIQAAALFTPISPPILRSIDPVEVANFLKERERYEAEVESKRSELPSLKSLPYKASIDRALLKHLLFMQKLDKYAPEATIENLTDEQLQAYLTSLVQRAHTGYEPELIESAIASLSWPDTIIDPDARVTTYCSNFFERLDSVGCGNFKIDNPKHTVSLMLRRVKPYALRDEMRRRLKFDESLEKDVRKFIRVLITEAQACQKYGEKGSGKLRTKKNGDNQSRNLEQKKIAAANLETKTNIDLKSTQKPKRLPTVCLHPTHQKDGVRHYMSDCDLCTKEHAEKLLKENKERRKKESQAKRVHNDQQGVLFRAKFAGAISESVCADIGADDNIMDEYLLNKIKSTSDAVQVEQLTLPRHFVMAAKLPDGSIPKISCSKIAIIDTELHIRHGTGQVLRNLRWFVTSQHVGEPLLGRPILEALGLSARNILAAAAEKYAGVANASELLENHEDHGAGRISRVLEGVFHADGTEESSDDETLVNVSDLGPESDKEWEIELTRQLSLASANGISTNGLKNLESIVRRYRDIIRIRLNGGPPARVPPLELRLKPDAAPVRAKPRRYPPQKRKFLANYVGKLIELGFAKPAEKTEWVAAPLIVPKKPPAMFRLTMDYRPVNAATVPMTWPMPHIDAVLSELRGATVFAGIDFCSGYWQLPLHPESQHLHAFMTPNGVVQPTRTTQGGCNSAANFQASVEPCFASIRKHILAWLDDFAIHGKTELELLEVLQAFFDICRDRNLIVSLPKSTLFAKSIRWCGRYIDTNGVRMDPANFSALINASEPVNAAELSQYVHALTWMANVIPRFAERVAPLRRLLELAYKRAGKRTKKSITRFKLRELGWNQEHSDSFQGLQQQLVDCVTTAHRNPSKHLCAFTDASEKYWAAAVAQCEKSEISKPPGTQHLEPLAFLSGQFNDTQEHWSTYEREAYAIVQTFHKLNYLFACDTTTVLFTDHRNLLFAFHPLAMEPSFGRHKVLKVVRWALFLSSFNYRIEHIPGDRNVMADILTRWMRGYRGQLSKAKRIAALNSNHSVPRAPVTESEWPSRDEILTTQNQSKDNPPTSSTKQTDGLITIARRTWIPREATDLKLRLLTIAHAGMAGHRGTESTLAHLSEVFTWYGIRQDTRDFVSACLLCVMSKSGSKVPRPLANTLHAMKPGDVLHFDYLFLGESESKDMYVLALKDDFSGYCMLAPTSSACHTHAAATLSRWNRTFTPPEYWVSDQGTHFINSTLKELARTHNIHHRPTVAYSPWCNGTVERLMREILTALRAILGELNLAPQDWSSVIEAVPPALNEAPLKRLGKNNDGTTRTPLQVMTGIRPRRAILRIISDVDAPNSAKTLTVARAQQIISIEKLQRSIDDLHKNVSEKITSKRRREIEAHNRSTNIVVPRFSIGDFVLVRRPHNRGHKLQFRWCGPKRVAGICSPLVYMVTNLEGSKSERVHCARMIFYSNAMDNTEVSSEVLELADKSESRYEIVDAIVALGKAPDGIFFKVRWDGLPDERDHTWHDIHQLYQDIPQKVKEFLKSTDDVSLAVEAARQLDISL